MEWHELDPVDDFELNRNDVIYSYQGNRNPFIDHPELVDFLWGDEQQTSWNSSLSNPSALVNRKLFVPNPIQTSYIDISPHLNPNFIQIYNAQGKRINQSPGTFKRLKMPVASEFTFYAFFLIKQL